MSSVAETYRADLDRRRRMIEAWEAFEDEGLLNRPPSDVVFFHFIYEEKGGRMVTFVGLAGDGRAVVDHQEFTQPGVARPLGRGGQLLGAVRAAAGRDEVLDQPRQDDHAVLEGGGP